MRWFNRRKCPQPSFKDRVLCSETITPNGRRIAEQILEGDTLIIERLCNIIGEIDSRSRFQKPQ